MDKTSSSFFQGKWTFSGRNNRGRNVFTNPDGVKAHQMQTDELIVAITQFAVDVLVFFHTSPIVKLNFQDRNPYVSIAEHGKQSEIRFREFKNLYPGLSEVAYAEVVLADCLFGDNDRKMEDGVGFGHNIVFYSDGNFSLFDLVGLHNFFSLKNREVDNFFKNLDLKILELGLDIQLVREALRHKMKILSEFYTSGEGKIYLESIFNPKVFSGPIGKVYTTRDFQVVLMQRIDRISRLL